MFQSRRWIEPNTDPETVAVLRQQLEIPRPVAESLAVRGFEKPEAAKSFLDPRLAQLSDPMLLPDMEKAVERIWRAIEHNEPIVVHGDYDVDGVTSTALVTSVLRRLGADVEPVLPHRMEQGYGLALATIEACARDRKAGLIVTVDCGTNAVASIKHANKLGIDVVVTDHHEVTDLAPALATVNPKRTNDSALRILAGVGVAFKLCHGLLKVGRDENRPGSEMDIREYLHWVALGTVCDIVPLLDENRILVSAGLARMAKTPDPGLIALIDVAGIRGKVTGYHLGYQLGPRLNAAGRLGTAREALDLLLSDDPQQALHMARELDAANRERQATERSILKECRKAIEMDFDPRRNYGLVTAGQDWHPGVVGIVASRICRRFYRPTLVIALDKEGGGRGSGRSIPGFDLVAALHQCEDLLVKFGGHAMAAGLEIEEANVGAFRERFNNIAQGMLADTELSPTQRIDAWVELDNVDEGLFKAQEKMAPFGAENPRPVWAVCRVQLDGPPKVVGKDHLRLQIRQGNGRIGGIGFGLAEHPLPEGPLDVAFTLHKNTYRGSTSLEMQVQDVRAHI